ncbi:MAG: heme exporter protein CcmD [Bradyrhizobium sp.]|jgi:heme exporter protein D
MSLGPYTAFIVTSYLVVLAIVVLLIAWIAIDYRRQKRRLSELESEGITRRSERQTDKT